MNQLTWQDYLKERYDGSNISASVNQVHAALADALKAGQIANDPVLSFTGLVFREELERNGFSCNMAPTAPKKAKPVSRVPGTETTAQASETSSQATPTDSDEDFDIDQAIAEMQAGTFETFTVDRGFTGNTQMVAAYQQNRDKTDPVYENLFRDNQGWVRKVAGHYLMRAKHTCLTYDDLVGYGNEGLMKAIERFDPEMGIQLSTYATFWIKQSIERNLINDGTMIRLPVHLVEKLNKLFRLEQAQLKKRGKVDVERICAELEIDQHTYKRYKQIDKQFRTTASLNQLIAVEGADGDELGDFVSPDEDLGLPPAPNPETEAMNEDVKRHLRELVFGLKPREAQVIRFRFGLDDNQPHTLEEVGQAMGVTRERIRQIEVKALKRLKNQMSRDNKEDYTIEY
jgi:RNA polymerase primary sigma factor